MIRAKISKLQGKAKIIKVKKLAKLSGLKSKRKVYFTVKVKRIEAEKIKGGNYGDESAKKYTGSYFN